MRILLDIILIGSFVCSHIGTVDASRNILRNETNICEKNKFVKFGKIHRPLVGAFKVQCTKDGRFKPKQCHKTSGYCFCADENSGQPIEFSIFPAKNFDLNCSNLPGRCSLMTKSIAEGETINMRVPQCDSDGFFQRKQEDFSEGRCWCVRPSSGYIIPGTEMNCSLFNLDCSRAKSNCEKEREEKTIWDPKFLPECEDDGHYVTKQCFGAFCYCVDKVNGSKINLTNEEEAKFPFDCDNPPKGLCESIKTKLIFLKITNKFVPRCDAKGNFITTQCSFVTRDCWCVDKFSGGKFIGTTQPYQQFSFRCEEQKTKCEYERDVMKIGNGPVCNSTGHYNTRQCDTRNCWCTNSETGDKIANTTVSIGYFNINCDDPDYRTMSCSEAQSMISKEKFLYKCDKNGNYSTIQCNKTYCSCVDNSSGIAVKNTIKNKNSFDLDCDNSPPRVIGECASQRKYGEQINATQKAHCKIYKKCNSDKCWCQDDGAGRHVQGTIKSIKRFNLNCSDPAVSGCKMADFLNGQQKGNIVDGYIKFGDRVKHVCDDGYKLVGPVYRRCNAIRSFAKEDAKCVKI